MVKVMWLDKERVAHKNVMDEQDVALFEEKLAEIGGAVVMVVAHKDVA